MEASRNFVTRSLTPLFRTSVRLKAAHRPSVVKDSRHSQSIIQRRMNSQLDKRKQLLNRYHEKAQGQWKQRINSFGSNRYFPELRKRVFVKGLDKVAIKSRDILEVSMEEFENSQKSPGPAKNSKSFGELPQQSLVNMLLKEKSGRSLYKTSSKQALGKYS